MAGVEDSVWLHFWVVAESPKLQMVVESSSVSSRDYKLVVCMPGSNPQMCVAYGLKQKLIVNH